MLVRHGTENCSCNYNTMVIEKQNRSIQGYKIVPSTLDLEWRLKRLSSNSKKRLKIGLCLVAQGSFTVRRKPKSQPSMVETVGNFLILFAEP